MKLSEAIALGSHVIKPLAGIHLNLDRSAGCAWGMANIAAPLAYGEFYRRAYFTPAFLPCDCKHDAMIVGSGMTRSPGSSFNVLANVIVHLFNYHVATKQDWTMEQLIDWVRANEPADLEVVEEKIEDQEKVAV